MVAGDRRRPAASNRTIESADMTGSPSLTGVPANPERTAANPSWLHPSGANYFAGRLLL
jgi:hypothetical protein